jgi:dTDP-4-amino-4,6-dideoxygalactose transaminase
LLHDEAGMGISRDLFTVALRAEGVPVGTGYVRTLYENPVFMQKIAYGSKGCPWTCGHYQGDVTYAKGQCPTAEALLEKRFLWFYHISYASTEEDMADIVRAVRKVVDRRVEIAENAARLSNQLGFRSQGRLGIAPAQMRGR